MDLKKIYIHKMDQRGPHIQFAVRRGRWGFVPPRSPQFKCFTVRHGELRPMKPGIDPALFVDLHL